MDSVKEVKTPEHIAQDMNLRKAIKKAVYVAESSNMVQFKDKLSHLVSPKKNLFDPGNYLVYDNCHPSSVISTNKQAQDVVSHCCKFVELVTIIDDHWFFITSFSVFIHDSNLDDCADASRVGLQLSAVAFIRKKTRAGKDYFEFTLRFNNVELLATSGFFGCVDDDTVAAFVGSSVQGLPKSIIERYDTLSSTYIFITKAIAPSIAVERLINQYLKRDAAKKWMLVSKRFKEEGFEPSHPLSFKSIVPIQKAASLLMKIIANKALYCDAIKESIAELKDKQGKKPTASGKLVRRYLNIFSVQSEYQQNEYDEVKMKRDMLYIYENTLAGPLKSRNIRVAKQAITELISGRL